MSSLRLGIVPYRFSFLCLFMPFSTVLNTEQVINKYRSKDCLQSAFQLLHAITTSNRPLKEIQRVKLHLGLLALFVEWGPENLGVQLRNMKLTHSMIIPYVTKTFNFTLVVNLLVKNMWLDTIFPANYSCKCFQEVNVNNNIT